jgi:hypothetical protein
MVGRMSPLSAIASLYRLPASAVRVALRDGAMTALISSATITTGTGTTGNGWEYVRE